jgi:hypothetical protein
MAPHNRKFNLPDIAVLVAVTGAGLGWYRAYVQTAGQYFGTTPWTMSRSLSSTYLSITCWGGQWAPVLVSTTVAVFVFSLRAPRPAWRWLRRQPGWVACASALAASLLFLAETFGRRLIRDTMNQGLTHHGRLARRSTRLGVKRDRLSGRGGVDDLAVVRPLACRAELDRSGGADLRRALDRLFHRPSTLDHVRALEP